MDGFSAANGFIKDIGRPPIIVRNIDASITLPNAATAKATILDEQGYPRAELTPQAAGQGLAEIVLPQDALYTLITRP